MPFLTPRLALSVRFFPPNFAKGALIEEVSVKKDSVEPKCCTAL
jgi:hypothetical protein